MPEIVEVRKYCDLIRKAILNKNITNINILKGRYKNHKPFLGYNKLKKHYPLKAKQISSKGKLIYIIFENNIILLCTLGLSGGWIYYKNNKYIYSDNDKYNIGLDNYEEYKQNMLKHLNIEFVLDNSTKLYFVDMLSYGTINILFDIDLLNAKLSKIGYDIMEPETDLKIFTNAIQKYQNKEIGLVLVDQKVIAGLGNYLRADILWLARISPFRLVKNIDNLEFRRIYNYSKKLTLGEYYNNYNKLPKHYNRLFFVYQQERDIYNNKVYKKELYSGSQKRFVYYVPKLQK